MEITARHFISPVAALVTLAIGVAAVEGVAMFSSPLQTAPHTGSQNESAKQETHDFFAPPPAAMPEERATELSCYDPNILPIWSELKKDPEFVERTSGWYAVINCSEALDIKRVDLNRDGNAEFLVRGKSVPLCGAVGNCAFWVFEKRKARIVKILSASDYVDVAELGDQVMRSRTRGYSDLLLRGHFSAAETGYYTYKFNGKRYVEARCMYEVPNRTRGTEGGWEMITCEEFERR